MNKIFFTLVFCFASTFAFAKAPQQIDTEKLSEAFGHFLVKSLSNAESTAFAFNYEKIIQGMQQALAGKPAPMKEEEYAALLIEIQEHLFTEAATTNLAQANQFLKDNANVSGVCALEDKLQYKVLQEGKGPIIQEESSPLLHYKGSLLDGTVFADSSESGGTPITLSLTQTIPGFTKGLVGMKEGEKRTLYIHPDLAYGESGTLPPNSLLIFDIEIIQANTTNPS